MSIPSLDPHQWATSPGKRETPSAGLQSSGWIAGTPVAAKLTNGLLGNLADWVRYLAGRDRFFSYNMGIMPNDGGSGPDGTGWGLLGSLGSAWFAAAVAADTTYAVSFDLPIKHGGGSIIKVTTDVTASSSPDPVPPLAIVLSAQDEDGHVYAWVFDNNAVSTGGYTLTPAADYGTAIDYWTTGATGSNAGDPPPSGLSWSSNFTSDIALSVKVHSALLTGSSVSISDITISFA